MKENTDIQDYLKKLRRSRGFTLGDLAKRSGFDKQQISKIERGKKRLTVDGLVRLADALEIPPAEMIQKIDRSSITGEPETSNEGQTEGALSLIVEKVEVFSQNLTSPIGAQQKAKAIASIYREMKEFPFHLQEKFVEKIGFILRSFF
jgi:transcriptional regulator with XRE-family HTH domain